MISVFGWPDPNTAFDQSEHAFYTCYYINRIEQCCAAHIVYSCQQYWRALLHCILA